MNQEPTQSVRYCQKCGRALENGETGYLVTVNVVADFDGTVEPPGNSRQLSEMWKGIEEKTEEELMDEVAQRFSFVICKPCRDSWVENPLGGTASEPGSGAGRVH